MVTEFSIIVRVGSLRVIFNIFVYEFSKLIVVLSILPSCNNLTTELVFVGLESIPVYLSGRVVALSLAVKIYRLVIIYGWK